MNINEIAEHAYKRALERGKITEVSAPMKRYAECTNSLKDEFCELLKANEMFLPNIFRSIPKFRKNWLIYSLYALRSYTVEMTM